MRLLSQSIDGGNLVKRVLKCIAVLLAFSVLLTVPVSAQEISPYASNYFMSQSAYLSASSSTSFQVRFTVTAVGTMNKLGVNYIDIERSSDGENWSVVKTYSKDSYSNLVASNTYFHSGSVTYSSMSSGYQYRAYVDFYAKNGTGTASYGAYAYF